MLIRIWFRLFTLIRIWIGILTSSEWCESVTSGLQTLNGSILSPYAFIVSAYGHLWLHLGLLRSWIRTLMRIRVRIQLLLCCGSGLIFPKWCGSGSGSATLVSTHFVRNSQAIELWFTNCLIANHTIMFIICHCHICHFAKADDLVICPLSFFLSMVQFLIFSFQLFWLKRRLGLVKISLQYSQTPLVRQWTLTSTPPESSFFRALAMLKL